MNTFKVGVSAASGNYNSISSSKSIYAIGAPVRQAPRSARRVILSTARPITCRNDPAPTPKYNPERPYQKLGQTPSDVGSQGGMPTLAPTKAPEKVRVKSDVRALDLGSQVTLFRCYDDEEGRFEPEYKRERGSTENAYLIQTANKNCLIDLPEGAWSLAFATQLKKKNPGPLNFIVLSHFNPRMCASLITVLKSQPSAAAPLEVWCSNPTLLAITALLKRGSPAFNRELYDAWTGRGSGWGLRARLLRVTTGTRLSLGDGHELSFLLANISRWPECMFTYDPVSQKLFTSKFFGAHTMASDKKGLDAGGLEDYKEDWSYYFDTLIGPIAQQALKIIQRTNIKALDVEVPLSKGEQINKSLKNLLSAFLRPNSGTEEEEVPVDLEGKLAVATICPRHGPVVRNNLKGLLELYDSLLADRVNASNEISVAVIYASAYGNTSIMANAVVTGLERSGVNVKLLDCEFSKASEVLELVKGCQGFALGSPTLGGHTPTPVSEALGAILKGIERDVPYGVFGSYGWSGEAVAAMQNRLIDGGFKPAFDPISLKFKPTPDMIEVCEAAGDTLAQTVKQSIVSKKIRKKKVIAEKISAMSVDVVSRAVGRITTAASVLTANINGEDFCSLVSWVSQASFNPPAVTVALSKESTPQALMLLNAKLTINILGNKNQALMRALLNKGFKSGDSCFEGVEIERNEETQCAIIKDAASYLECTVTNRLDVGDHWVLLVNIDEGKVLDTDATTYFHHRQVGTEY